MKNLKSILICISIVFILISCSKKSDFLPVEELSPMDLLESKTWEVYDHTMNGALHWQAENNIGGVYFTYTNTAEDSGTIEWEFKDLNGEIQSFCGGDFETINESNVLHTFTSPECEMGVDAFVLIITPTVEGLLLNGTIQGNSWILRLR